MKIAITLYIISKFYEKFSTKNLIIFLRI